jgi:hypothetical protein
VHLLHPVPEAVHHELQDLRGLHVQRVAGPGEILIPRGPSRFEAVVREVVDPAEGQRRAAVIPLGGVVVDDVEDHFEAGGVQRAHQRLELDGGGHGVARRREARIGGEEAERVVAPVVDEPALDERVFVHVRMHRHQLDGGDPELSEVIDNRRRGQPQIGTAQVGRHERMQRRHAFHVQLVDDRLVPRHPRRRVPAPIERARRDHAERRVRSRVQRIGGAVAVGALLIGEQRRMPDRIASDRARVGIEQQFVAVEAQAACRIPGAIDAESVEQSRPGARQVAVPHAVGAFLKGQAHRFETVAGGVEETEVDRGGVRREDREIDARAVPRRAKRGRRSGPQAHARVIVPTTA